MSVQQDLKKQYQQNRYRLRQQRRNLREEQKNLRRRYHIDKSLLRQSAQGEVPSSEEEDFQAYRPAKGRREDVAWEKLDTSAIMYPVITGESMSNVFRVYADLKEDIQPELLQKALEMVLPKFPAFDTRLRQGTHWFYLEENGKPAPRVTKEDDYPCRYINASRNRSYLFRVTYFRSRINLEVFHVLADGSGAMMFLKEITYQYLRLAHVELGSRFSDEVSSNTTVSSKDWFQDFYDKKPLRPYRFQRAFLLTGALLPAEKVGILHGYMKVEQVKELAKHYNATVNDLIVSVLIYSIWQENQCRISPERPIVICIPVNLRPVFGVDTVKNFFVNVNAVFKPPENKEVTIEDVIRQVQDSLRPQLTKEALQQQLSKNVSTEKNLLSRMVPMIFKNPVLRSIHRLSEKSITSTVTNIGIQKADEPYSRYIDFLNVVLAHAKGQPLKASVSSYEDRMVLTVTSVLKSTGIPRRIYQFFAEKGLDVGLTSNGVYR